MIECNILISEANINKNIDTYFLSTNIDKMSQIDWKRKYIKGSIRIFYNNLSILDTTKNGYCYPVGDTMEIVRAIFDFINTGETFASSVDAYTFSFSLKKINNRELEFNNLLDDKIYLIRIKDFIYIILTKIELFFQNIYTVTNNSDDLNYSLFIKNLNISYTG